MEWIALSELYRRRVLLKEDADVSIKHQNGNVNTYRVEDAYAKILTKQIQQTLNSTLDADINTIFKNSDWKCDKDNLNKLKNILIHTPYEHSIELIDYLSKNKSSLLKLNQLNTRGVFNFLEAVANSLPGEFNTPGITDLIRDIHFNIVPGASTGVGLGESTFSIFGTAVKAKAGDLVWDGLAVEVKTNGKSNQGATLGGDGNINKITDRLSKVVDYVDLKLNDINNIRKALDSIISKSQSEKTIPAAKREFDTLKVSLLKILPPLELTKAIKGVSIDEFFNTIITKKFTPHTTPHRAEKFTLYNALINKLDAVTPTLSTKISNLPSQISTFLTDDGTVEDYINVFAETKTYKHSNVDFKSQLKEFFKTNNHLEFNPRHNYDNFSRLIGAISIVCYKDHMNFDILITLNDLKGTGAVINCQEPTVSSIYRQLINIPQIKFDLYIDVYEGGKYRSSLTRAPSPRIRLD